LHAPKNYFLVVLEYFSYKNGPNDLVRGLFLSLDSGTYIPPTCRLLSTYLGVPKIPENSMKNFFLVVLDYFFYKNEPKDLVRGLFSSLDIGIYFPPTCGPSSTFLGSFGGAQMP
jgi:hypothetical protein